MKFYQVKREADNKKLDKNWNIFVGGELFTEKEMENMVDVGQTAIIMIVTGKWHTQKDNVNFFWKILLKEKFRKIRHTGSVAHVFRLQSMKWRRKSWKRKIAV